MNNKNGFTLVEILAAVAILAVLATAAGLGITSSINKQKQKLAYQAEENIAEAAKSYASNKINNYLKPCVNSDGSFVTITEKKVNAMNKALRESEGIASDNEDLLYQNMKIYSNYANTRDEEKAFLNNYIKVGNKTCFKTVTVGELIEQGYIKDDDHMCNKASIIVIYRRADAKNTAGIMDTVQETGICNSKRTSSSGPVITVTPFSNLAYSTSKSIKITIHSDSTTLNNPLTLNYDFTTSDKKGPSSYTKSVTLTRTSDDELSGTIPMNNEVDKTLYLWIKSGIVIDNKNNKTSTIVTGPYAFSPIVLITYKKNAAGVTGCDEKKAVVFEKQYGKNANNMSAPLCIPEKRGYNFVGWTYQSSKTKITDTSKVNMKLDHYLSDNWEPKEYEVTLDKNGATNTPTTSIKTTYDSNVLDPATITLPIREYTVSGFGLDSSRNSDKATVSSTGSLKSTYIFNGWNTSATGGSQVINNSESPALLENVPDYTGEGGIWQRDESTNKLYANWTSVPVTLPTIAKTGYDCGWTTSSTGTTISNIGGSSYTPSVDTIMYGVCKACKYKIIFNKNNASATGTMSDKECTYDQDCKLTNNAYSLSDYSFNGWNTKTDSSGVNYSNGETVKNLTSTCNGNFNLYANWCQNCASVSHGSCSLDVGTAGVCKYTTSCDTGYHISAGAGTRTPTCSPNRYRIRVYKGTGIGAVSINGGFGTSSPAEEYADYGTNITIGAMPEEYYQFEQWNDNDTNISRTVKVIGNMDFTATARKNRLTIKFYSNGGTLSPGKDQHCTRTACGSNTTNQYCSTNAPRDSNGDLRELSGCQGVTTGNVYTMSYDYDHNGYCEYGVNNYADIDGATLYMKKSNSYPTFYWLIGSGTSNAKLCEDARGFKTAVELLEFIDKQAKTTYADNIRTKDVTVSLYAGWASTQQTDCDAHDNPTCP